MIHRNLKVKLLNFDWKHLPIKSLCWSTRWYQVYSYVGQLQLMQQAKCRILERALTIAKEESSTEEFFYSLSKLLHYYSIERMYQIHETGDRRSIHKKLISPKEKSNISEAVGVRCAKKRGSILILLLRGVL